MVRRAARWSLRALIGVGIALVTVVVLVVLVARSDWGLEQARSRIVAAMDEAIDGSVRVGSLEGNLLSDVTLRDVVIEDAEGDAVIEVEEARADLSFRAALSRRIELSSLELVGPVLRLEQDREGAWNVAGLVAEDTVGAPAADSAARGFGSWVRISQAFIRDGRVEIRQPWPPENGLLADSTRVLVDSTGPHPVMVREIQGLNARLQNLVLADPDAGMSGALTSLEAVARPLEGPPLEIRDLEGRFTMDDDELRLDEVQLWLPQSRLSGEAVISLDGGGGISGRVAAEVAGDDLLWLDPSIPDDASATGEIVVRSEEGTTRLTATGLDVRFDGARVRGRGEMTLGDSLLAGPADLRFEEVDTRLVRRFMPGVEVPVDGRATGRVSLGSGADASGAALQADVRFVRRADEAVSHFTADGRLAFGAEPAVEGLAVRLSPLDLSLARDVNPAFTAEGALEGTVRLDGPLGGMLAVNADVTHRSGAAGASNLTVEGGMRAAEGLAFEDLIVRAEPLQVPVVEAFAGPLPIGGTLRGRVTLDGAPDRSLFAEVDVTHADTTGSTHLVGSVSTMGTGPGRTIRADVQAPELSLATVGRFAPAAGLRGSATGRIEAEGPLDRLAVDVVLEPSGGGVLAVAGMLDAADPGSRYDLDAGLRAFDLAAVSNRAPATALWGSASIDGGGIDPATMDALVQVALADSADGELSGADGSRGVVRLDGRASGGLATIEQAEVRLASATFTADGSLGIAAGREGELAWALEVDSLADFASLMPADSLTEGAVAPRPAVQAQRIARTREASMDSARQNAVERAAAGLPAIPAPEVDTLPHLPRDSLAGSASFTGTAAGGLHRLAVRAEGEVDDIVAMGARVVAGGLSFEADGLELLADPPDSGAVAPAGGDPLLATRAPLSLSLDAELDTAWLAGFQFESLTVEVEHGGTFEEGEGTAFVAAAPDPDRDIVVRAGYDLALDRRSLRLDSLALRFDTTTWTSTGPGAVSWGTGLAVEDLELVSGDGRIRVDGRLPEAGVAEAGDSLVVDIEGLPVEQIMALLQDTLDARGVLDLHARVQGSREDPSAQATVSLVDGSVDGTELPDFDASLDWADDVLTADARLLGESSARPGLLDTLAVVRGTMALALPGDTAAAEAADAGALDLVLRADSLPLESLPSFTAAVSDVHGLVRGEVAVSGTLGDPHLEGSMGVELGGLDLTALGVRLRDVEGMLRMDGRTVSVDSLSATSGGGSMVAAGSIALEGDEGLVADLTFVARDAIVADFDLAEGVRADADLRVVGPMTALAVTGTARVREGIFYAPVEQRQALDLEGAEAARAISASEVAEEALPERTLLSGLRADVRLRVDRNTWVRALDGTSEIYTPDDAPPLSVRYDAAQALPALDGVLHADRGEWTFAGRRFELTTGTATFLRTTELDPQLQLTAVHEVARPGRDPMEIQITVGGRLQAPEVTLTSNAQPPLSQSDLLSYLVFGTSSSSLMQVGGSGLAGGGGAGELGTLAGQQLTSIAIGSLVEQAFSDVEARSGRYGLDVFRITAAELPEELAFDDYLQNVLRGTQIEAGKYVTPRLFVAARGRPTTEVWPGFGAEYRTPRGFRWTAAWEPRYLPLLPSFGNEQTADQTRALSTFLFWMWRY